MTTSNPTPESRESEIDLLVMEEVETADTALDRNKEEIFEKEKKGYARFGEWVNGEIKELEADIAEECGPMDAN